MNRIVSSLWSKRYYSAPIRYINSVFIREYDISKADISIFLSKGVITQEEFNFYYRIPSIARNVQMGVLQQKRPELKKILREGIEEARRVFFEQNEIQDHQVLSIRNDAIFLIDIIPKHTTFGSVVFKNKNTYTSFYKMPKGFNKEFYYFLDRVNGEERLDIKGLGDIAQRYHKDYMTDFLLVLFNSIELYPLDDAISLIQTFYNKYINKELDINYYRKYSDAAGYDTTIQSPILNTGYCIRNLSDRDKDIIDISYNARMIIELYKIVSSMYFSKK